VKPRRDLISARAGARCEYCRLPEALSGAIFHIEHVVPKSKGGTDGESNWALACPRCNERKGALIRARDPESGKEVELFHPRRHLWAKHFRWSRDCLRIEGRTAVGRATVSSLDLNALARQHLRLIWRDRLADLFPF
jgi:hypothetical protein